MTRIPTNPGGPPAPARNTENAPTEGKGKSDGKAGEGEGTFDNLLEQKAGAADLLRRESMRSLRSHAGATGLDKKKGKEESAAGFEGELRGKAEGLLHGEAEARIDPRGRRGEGSGSEGGSGHEPSQEETPSLRRFTGDVVIGDPSFATPQFTPLAEAAPAAPVVTKSDAIQRIEQIADRIVEAVQVQMNPSGATEVRLELDLGKLGHVDVELARGADGNLRIELSTVNAVTREVIRDNVAALAERLETRGVALEQIAVNAPDQPSFSWQGSNERDPRQEQQGREPDDGEDEDA